MESIRQGADNNSKSFQANGLLQSQEEYNTARKIIGEIIARVRKPGGFHDPLLTLAIAQPQRGDLA